MTMFVNTRAIIEQETAEGIEILIQRRDKPQEAGQGMNFQEDE